MRLITYLDAEFLKAQDPENALQMSAYMRNQFPFYGIKKPLRAALQKKCFARHILSSEQELVDVLHILWEKPEREYQMAACELAFKYKKLWTPHFICTLEHLIRTKSWWDSVDTISSKLLGELIKKYPNLQNHMDMWIADSNFWIRRAALIHQLSYKKKTDVQRLFAYCSTTMHEKEFFIRKAIGWSLRQYSRTDPEAVRQFITTHKDSLSPLSYKEAGKYCL